MTQFHSFLFFLFITSSFGRTKESNRRQLLRHHQQQHEQKYKNNNNHYEDDEDRSRLLVLEDNDDEFVATTTHIPAQSRIVGGTNTQVDEYPFFVSWAGCGASVVARDVILTAAHCNPLPDNTVRINHSRKSGIGIGGGRGLARTIIQRLPHPLFGGGGINYDYMLMKLNEPIPLSDYEPITLNDNSNLPRDNQELTVIGFGRTAASGSTPNALQEVQVRYIDTARCNRPSSYGGEVLDNTMFCAGVNGGGKDSCQGDSGGPIFIKNENDGSFIQTGIVSWGRGCAEARYPGVYSRVSGQVGWIRENICRLSSSKPSWCNSLDDADSDNNNKITVNIRFEIMYDEYPAETGWAFVQGDSVPLARSMGSIPDSQKNSLNKYYGQVKEGLLTFQISDSFNDGICCRYGADGYFQIFVETDDDEDDILLYDGDGDFNSKDEVVLLIDGPNTTYQPTKDPTRPPTRAPTPAPNGLPNTEAPTPPTPSPTLAPSVTTMPPTRPPTPSPTPPTTSPTLAPSATTMPPTRPPTPSPTAPCVFSCEDVSSGTVEILTGPPSTPNPTRLPTPLPTLQSPTRFPTSIPTIPPTTITDRPTTTAPDPIVVPVLEIILPEEDNPADDAIPYDELLRNFCTNDALNLETLLSSSNTNDDDDDEPFFVIELVKFAQPFGEELYNNVYSNAIQSSQEDAASDAQIRVVVNVTRTSQFPRMDPEWDQALIVQYPNIQQFLEFTFGILNVEERENAIMDSSLVWFATLNPDLPNKYAELMLAADSTITNFNTALLHVLKFTNQSQVNEFDEQTKDIKRNNGIFVQAWWDIIATCSSSSSTGEDDEDSNIDQVRMELVSSWANYAKAIWDPSWVSASSLREDGVDLTSTFSAFTTTTTTTTVDDLLVYNNNENDPSS